MADESEIPDGLTPGDEPVTTTQESVVRARKGLERDLAVFEAAEELFESAQPYIGRRYFARYKAYLDAGFTKAQAMALLKEHGVDEDDE